MKKYLFLTIILGAVISTNVNAQNAGVQAAGTQTAADQAAMLKQAQDKIRPAMMEKTGLTAAQVDRVVEINWEIRYAAGALKDISEEERKVKITELKALKEKKYLEILSPEQVKAVYAFYEDMGKNREKKGS